MKKILFVLLLFVSAVSFAQQNNLQDVVYLNNGSIIRGVIIEQIPNKSLKIQTSDGSVFAFSIDEVSKMTKEESLQKKYNSNKTRLFTAIEGGYSIGIGDWGTDRLYMNCISGYQFNPYFILGGGVGFRYYEESEISIPIITYFRANLSNGKMIPFFALSIGYNISLSEYSANGLVFEPSCGVSFAINNKNAITVGWGYSLDQFKYEVYDRHLDYETFNEMSGAITLKVGITF